MINTTITQLNPTLYQYTQAFFECVVSYKTIFGLPVNVYKIIVRDPETLEDISANFDTKPQLLIQ